MTTIQIDCPASVLPSKGAIVNALNSAAQIPSQLVLEAKDLVEAEAQKIRSVAEEIDAILESAKKVLSIKGISKPVFNDLKAPEIEWERVITNAIQEYHSYVMSKMLQLIASVIPVNFAIPVLGLSIDIVAYFSNPSYAALLKKQIRDQVDKFYAMIPDAYKMFGGEFGIEFPTLKAEAVWSYIQSLLNKGALQLLHSCFGQLISTFNTIWTPLNLPALPALLNLNVESLVAAKVNAFKAKIAVLGSIDINIKNKLYDELISELESISLAGFNILSILGAEIDEKIVSAERQIERITEALRDFGEAYPKKLILDWMNLVKAFFNAIGLSALVQWITFTFCDFLKIIGLSTSISVPNGN